MKNKEIEELLNMLKKCAREDKATLKLNEIACKEILSYIEQLQKIPNKALDFIHKNSYKKGDGTIMYDTDIQELENILKGDSDENRNV